MKIFALFILVVASATSLKSGPYLPSGWRPQGPAFYLPSEVETTPKNPLQDTIVESEASGSDSLREYGPPKLEEVSQDITNQGLPDVVTDQPFFVIETKTYEEDVARKSNDELKAFQMTKSKVEELSEVKSTTEVEFITATETPVTAAAETTEELESVTESKLQGKSVDIEIKEETESELDKGIEIFEDKIETIALESEDASSNTASVREQEVKIGEIIAEEVKSVEGVNNIADALTNLESEIRAKQVQNQNQHIESKTIQDASITSSLDGAPEGFLEYGPPGFREYGPPKEETTTAALSEEKEVAENETRRRRFSPKFRSTRKSH